MTNVGGMVDGSWVSRGKERVVSAVKNESYRGSTNSLNVLRGVKISDATNMYCTVE